MLRTAAETWPLVDVSLGKGEESADTMSSTDGKRNKGEFNYNSTWGKQPTAAHINSPCLSDSVALMRGFIYRESFD